MSQGKTEKSTPIKSRVTLSDKLAKNTWPVTNSSKTETTPSTSAEDTADDQKLSGTINRIFSKKLRAIQTGKDASLKETKGLRDQQL